MTTKNKTVKSNSKNTPVSPTLSKKEFDFSNMMNFANLKRLILRDLEKTNKMQTFFSKYTKEDVIKYLKNPETNSKQLRDISIYLYNASSHYRRLISYFAKMALYYYIVIPYRLDVEKVDKNKFKNQYKKILDLLDNMNIKHEFIKVMTTAFREDVFYGYEYSSKDSYFIQKLNPDYCKISSIEDGCLNFAFDFTLFDNYPEKLNQYDPEFKEKHDIYLKDKTNKRWQELDSKKTICVKINEDIDYPVVPFVGVLESLYDIEDFKALKKAKTEIGNYKMLALKIPFDQDKGDFIMDLEIAKDYYRMMGAQLPENIGLVLSPMEIQDFDFEKDKADNDEVANSERDYWSSAGVSQLLFNSEKSSSATIGNSIKSDSDIVFSVLRSLERWLNRKLKFESGVYKFRVMMLDITRYNQKEFFESTLKAGQFGLPVKTMIGASLGYSPSDVVGMTFLENEVLEYQIKFIPLQSSHTQTGDKGDEGGAPKKDDDDLSEEGIKTREGDNRTTE